jgi:hypothetical protein
LNKKIIPSLILKGLKLPIMNKCILSICITMLFFSISLAQTPVITFQNSVGGDDWDRVQDILATSDGGSLLSGISESDASFDKSEGHFGNDDGWIVKIDANGELEWENTLGGDLRAYIAGAQKTPDGGFIVAGWTISSNSGDVIGTPLGGGDCWVFKLDASGNMVWQKLVGGDGADSASSITKMSNGNYLIGANSNSNTSGDKTEDSFGEGDFWVFEINNDGEIIWDKTVGGSLQDSFYAAEETPDGGVILIGNSESNISGMKSENTIGTEGWIDYWAVKLDSNHNKVWDSTIGGDFVDTIRNGFVTQDGGCLLLGYSFLMPLEIKLKMLLEAGKGMKIIG